VTLRVGALTDQVTVNESVNPVETSNPKVSSTVTNEFIQNIPLNYRNVYNVQQLAPGVTGFGLTSDSFSVNQGAVVQANGQRSMSNGYYVDGAPVARWVGERNVLEGDGRRQIAFEGSPGRDDVGSFVQQSEDSLGRRCCHHALVVREQDHIAFVNLVEVRDVGWCFHDQPPSVGRQYHEMPPKILPPSSENF
jgi:hypothetical protein